MPHCLHLPQNRSCYTILGGSVTKSVSDYFENPSIVPVSGNSDLIVPFDQVLSLVGRTISICGLREEACGRLCSTIYLFVVVNRLLYSMALVLKLSAIVSELRSLSSNTKLWKISYCGFKRFDSVLTRTAGSTMTSWTKHLSPKYC